ncbi:hypothetical protein AB1Y20_019696 [Prymnesium parvum]|uniref:Ubiquinol-cytochrome c chaperone domain-containing protein n=1 Tax=Prymnesium parvum TaxID=97485 RepID=A0AB34JV34_PRYPA
MAKARSLAKAASLSTCRSLAHVVRVRTPPSTLDLSRVGVFAHPFRAEAQRMRLGSCALRQLSTAANAREPPKGFISSAPRERSLVEELHRLEHETPWWAASLFRLVGMFTPKQRQAAAGGDLYYVCGMQSLLPEFFDPARGGLDDRYYIRFQLVVLHCWICHVRLRQEPKEHYEHLFKETMEKVWGQAEIDLAYQFNMDYLQLSKHLKEMQFTWHGTVRALDAAVVAEDAREQLHAVLQRNLYTDGEGKPLVNVESNAAWLTEYVLLQLNAQMKLSSTDALNGIGRWADLSELTTEK